jgi:hypothetical protein
MAISFQLRCSFELRFRRGGGNHVANIVVSDQYTLRGIVQVLETFLLLHHRQNNLTRKWDKCNKESNIIFNILSSFSSSSFKIN